jgi:hypothetical protein
VPLGDLGNTAAGARFDHAADHGQAGIRVSTLVSLLARLLHLL